MKNYTRTLKSYGFFFALALTPFTVESQNVIHLEEFDGTSGSWTAVSVEEPLNEWTFTNGYAEIYGIGGVDDEDWLISPAINLDAQEKEYFQFEYLDQHAGPYIELKYSTDYTGSGNMMDISNATWSTIDSRVLDLNSISCFSTLLQKHPAIDISNICLLYTSPSPRD